MLIVKYPSGAVEKVTLRGPYLKGEINKFTVSNFCSKSFLILLITEYIKRHQNFRRIQIPYLVERAPMLERAPPSN